MVLEIAQHKDYKDFRRLFFSAFPPEERPPYCFIKWSLKLGKGELLIAKDSGQFVGFIHLIVYQDLVYLFFFAIDDAVRGQGYGSKILELVKKRHQGKRIFLAREPLDENADNAQQRLKRWEFYTKNGFVDLPMRIIEKGYTFETMGIGGSISPADYDALINDWCGKFIRKFADMHAF